MARGEWHPHYGFLKPGIKHVYLFNDSCCPGTGKGVLTSNLYFVILERQGKKFRIQAECPLLHPLVKESMYWYGFQTTIDSSLVVQFDSLPDKEKRRRIINGFDYYAAVLNDENFSVGHIDFAAEAVYDPMREEFARYWLKLRDSSLLAKWFKVHNLNGGSADEWEGETEGELFCKFPNEFCNVLKRVASNAKAFAIDTLKNSGIYYYVIYKVTFEEGYEKLIQQYKDLLDEKLGTKG